MADESGSDPHYPLSSDPGGGEGPGPTDLGSTDAPSPPDGDTQVADLTLRQLIAILRGQFVARGDAATIEAADASDALLERNKAAAERWDSAMRMVDIVGASPIDVQVCFLEGLVTNPDEADKFMEDPAGYAREAGVLLDPRLVRDISDVVLFGADLEKRLGDRLSRGALRDVARIRELPNGGMLGGAASAASATASAMFTAADKIDSDELLRIKGLDSHGVRLPGGRILRTPRDVATLLVTANTAVAIYATTAVSSTSVAAASDGARLSALRGTRETGSSKKK